MIIMYMYSLQQYSVKMTAGVGGQIQVFINGADQGYFRDSKTFTVNNGDSISVWCDADSGYNFVNLCVDGTTTCTTSRPFNFTANMNVSMTATFILSGGGGTCVYPCRSQQAGLLQKVTLSYPAVQNTALPNENVHVQIIVTDTSYLYGDNIEVDFINANTGACIDGKNIALGAGETQTLDFYFTMPASGNFLGRISAANVIPCPAIPCGPTCQDYKEFQVLQCIQEPCDRGTQKTPCTTNEINLGVACFPKSYIYIGVALTFAYVILSRR